MKKKSTHLFIALFFIAALGLVLARHQYKLKNKVTAFYPLQPRYDSTVNSVEWRTTQDKAAQLIRAVRDNDKDVKSRIELAGLYIQEARITGNAMYYDGAALKYIDEVLTQEPSHYEALTLKAIVYLSQHHFAEALDVAKKAQQAGPGNALSYGLLVDGSVEMGDYAAAVDYAGKMVSLRPDMRSYSRISYLREIHGDLSGAIEAMQSAVKAGMPGTEATAWARVQLGKLFEHTGDLQSAAMHYTIALKQRPHYAHALAGLGRIEEAKNNYTAAARFYKQADAALKDYSFKQQLAELHLRTGNYAAARPLLQQLISGMGADAKKGEDDENIGHYADKELAYVYLLTGDNEKALAHALAEYNRRPKNIDVNEAVAWAYYKMNKPAEALPYINTALRTGCKNPSLLGHAGLIFAKAGQQAKAKTLLREALLRNTAMGLTLNKECTATLQNL